MDKPLERILLADNDPVMHRLFCIAVDLYNFTIKFCSDGQEVLDTVGKFMPDMVLLNVSMPIMDGPTVLRAMREIPGLESIPVIFMTDHVETQEVAAYKRQGAVDVIEKPPDPLTLVFTLRQIWDRRLESAPTP